MFAVLIAYAIVVAFVFEPLSRGLGYEFASLLVVFVALFVIQFARKVGDEAMQWYE